MPAPFDLTGMALVVLAAVICGAACSRFRQPAMVGYILAGLVLGPAGFGLVGNREQVMTLADLGVLMLLFLVGMELSLSGFREVWRSALLATLLQAMISVAAMLFLSFFLGGSLGLAILLGFAVALSSTAVVIKMLENMNMLRSPAGRAVVGILVAQDLAFVPMMLIVTHLGRESFDTTTLLQMASSIAFLALLILYLGRREKIVLPFAAMAERNPDLTPLRALAFCFGAAALTGALGLTPAYGAFLAGLVISNSTERKTMMRGVWPIQSILTMVFFLSIGLLIEPEFIAENLGTVVLFLFMVTIFKTLLNIGVIRLAGQPWPHAVIAGILLAQIGEFSFLLSQAGLAHNLISADESRLVIAVAALSIVLSPLWMAAARRLLRLAILGVSSGSDVTRIVFGRHAPRVFALWQGLQEYLARRWPRLAFLLFGKRQSAEQETEQSARVIEADWQDLPPDRRQDGD